MSSGWPPEEDDDRRWEPVRHPSAVGAAHDSRDAARGYSGYAYYAPDDGANGAHSPGGHEGSGYEPQGYESANGYGDMPAYDGSDWSAPAPRSPDGSGGYAVSHLSQPGEAGEAGYDASAAANGANGYGAHAVSEGSGQAGYYGEIGSGAPGEPGQGGHGEQQGYADVSGAPVYPGGGYGSTGYDASLYAEPRYDDAGYQDPGHQGSGEYPAQGAGYGGPGYEGAGYEGGASAYQNGYAGQPGYEAGQGGYENGQPAYEIGPAGYEAGGQAPGQGGYGPAGEQGYQAGGYGRDGYAADGYGSGEYPAQGSGEYPAQGEGYGQDFQHNGGYSGGYVADGVGYANAGYAATYEPQGYDHRDYGDPRYDDPGYGDPGYEDAQYSGSGYQADGPGGAGGYDDVGSTPGQLAASAYGAPVYAGEDYATHVGQAGDGVADGYGAGGYGPDGYAAGGYGEDAGSGRQAGYAGAGYAAQGYDTGAGYQGPGDAAYADQAPHTAGAPADYAQGYSPGGFDDGFDGGFADGGGMLGEAPAGLPDPAPTGMLNTEGMLESSGLSDATAFSDRAGLPAGGGLSGGAGFLDASGPMRALGGTGVFDSSGFPAVESRDAGSATGVMESDVAELFADAPPAETTSFDIPSAAPFEGGAAAGGGAGSRGGSGVRDGAGGALAGRKVGRLARPGRPAAKPIGRRRGRSGDRRLWLALGGVMAAAVVAIVAIVLVGFKSGPGGPAHTLTTPSKLGSFVRRPALEQQMNVGQLRSDVVNMSSGQAKHVVEAVYENGTSTSGQTPQIILFIGGNLANASPTASVKSFTQKFKGAKVTSAGTLGGEAACVNATASEPGSVAMCAWFDNDSFGEVVSPTMNAAALGSTMRTIRPDVEKVVTKKQ
ncbi:MAG TPA: hypothetical protein VKV33_09850 [Streptosporangiaceae bacterium]|nr:hypothetical protein [Streptosporangiaceae bacterium]